jgi:uncharacterized membrane protein
MYPVDGVPHWWMRFWMLMGWGDGVAVLVLLVWAVTRAAGGQPGHTEDTPEQILKRRYARGEIDRDD